MRFEVLTIFPEMFAPFWAQGMVHRAIERGQISVSAVNIRDFADGRHRVTDDRPYGGGCGMVMKPEPLAGAIRAARRSAPGALTIHLSPQGRLFDQHMAQDLARSPGLILICGRYEGIDERICQDMVDGEISIGNYVLTGGELGAMVVMDAVTRLIPGVLGGENSADDETFSDDRVEHAHYTRPPVFETHGVPEVLLSGHHGNIERWRLESSLIRTLLKRPDLLADRSLSACETQILERWYCRLGQLLHPDGKR